MDIFVTVIYLLLPAVGIYFILRKRQEEEQYLVLKLIGYYILCAFSFSINAFMLPLGFIIYMIALRPKMNKKPKQQAAILGLVMFGILFISPHVETMIFEMPQEVSGSGQHVYSFAFEENWVKVQEELGIDRNATLQNFELAYHADGAIEEMNAQIVGRKNESFVFYNVTYAASDERFSVERRKLNNEWHQHQMIEADRFFSTLDRLPLKKVKPEHDFSKYELSMEGSPISYAVLSGKKYVIMSEEIVKVENYELPIRGFMLTACGKADDSSELGWGCDEQTQYFFDATYEQKESGPFSKEEAIAILRGNDVVDKWMEEHLGSYVRERSNGKFFLKVQGEWQQVTEEKYSSKEEPFKENIKLHDGKWKITYKSKLGAPPFIIEGIIDEMTGEIDSVITK